MLTSSSSPATNNVENANGSKRKRRPAGTPDPDAEVVSLSPRTLLESDRYVCEICNQGFQRDQNLQMHRRRHKVPWKLLKRDPSTSEARKRVFVCPEPSCLHHDPSHALGDLVGIKKHFRRKHSDNKQWVCVKCGKGYAVQSDYKAHVKTCGTRGHSCDCGRVFSRVESFIEHQDTCTATRPLNVDMRPHQQPPQPTASRTASSPSSTTETNLHRRELQLLPLSPSKTPHHHHQNSLPPLSPPSLDAAQNIKLQLSIGLDEKAAADEARMQAKRLMEVAEREFMNAKRIRLQAQAELSRALAVRDRAMARIDSTMVMITCQACKCRFRAMHGDESSVVTEGIEMSSANS